MGWANAIKIEAVNSVLRTFEKFARLRDRKIEIVHSFDSTEMIFLDTFQNVIY